MKTIYHHTQIGTLLIISLSTGLLFILLMLGMTDFNWVALMVGALLTLTLAIFSRLTVSVSDKAVTLQFNFGCFRKVFPLERIQQVSVVRNPFYYGWGIHFTPKGILYNVSGFDAVELILVDGKQYRIGSDDVQALADAIRQARSQL